MIIPFAGFLASMVFLKIGLHTGDPLLLIGSLVVFGLAVGSIDIADDKRYVRVSDDINHAGSYRVGYEREEHT